MDYGNGDVNEQDEIPPVKEERERAEAPREWRPNFDGDQQRKPGDARRELEIVDRGIQDVPLEKIDLRDSPVKGPEDFRKVSQSDLREGFSKLEQTVRPAVANGATQEDIAQIDQKDQTAADFQHSYARVYDAFYEKGQAIHLEKDGDTYTVINGYHRLSVASELGMTSVPAWVEEVRRR